MFVGKVTSRMPRSVLAQCRNSLLLYARQKQHHVPIPSNQFHSLRDSQSKVVTDQVSLLHHPVLNTSALQRFGISSSASPQPNGKDTAHSGNEDKSDAAAAKTGGDADPGDSDLNSESDSEGDLSRDDLVKLVVEKEQLLETRHKQIEQLQDKVVRAYAEMENVKSRTIREANENKKFAIQKFAKSLLDVADNLDRASSVVKDSFLKIDASKDSVGAVPLLKTLLEGVEMTEKQLAEVFKKFGVEKYDPMNEQFDPHRDYAVFQVPDPSKPPGTVVVVSKVGYKLHDRVIRPAEVGVTAAIDNEEAG